MSRTEKLKVRCLVPPATWDIELAACERSKKLKEIAKQKQEESTLDQAYLLEGMKSMLFAKIVLY